MVGKYYEQYGYHRLGNETVSLFVETETLKIRVQEMLQMLRRRGYRKKLLELYLFFSEIAAILIPESS